MPYAEEEIVRNSINAGQEIVVRIIVVEEAVDLNAVLAAALKALPDTATVRSGTVVETPVGVY